MPKGTNSHPERGGFFCALLSSYPLGYICCIALALCGAALVLHHPSQDDDRPSLMASAMMVLGGDMARKARKVVYINDGTFWTVQGEDGLWHWATYHRHSHRVYVHPKGYKHEYRAAMSAQDLGMKRRVNKYA